jgi:hypothetical protein
MRRALAVIMLVVASLACGKTTRPGDEPRVRLAQLGTLLEYQAQKGSFPVAPPCIGNPPVNAFSVPRTPLAVAGSSYEPSPEEWSGPWIEVSFALSRPIRAIYCYESDGRSFAVHASMDLDGDGVWAHYSRRGEFLNDTPVIGPLAVEREDD